VVGGGTGLGLAIARWVVDLHGGRIAVVDPEQAVTRGATGPGCRIRVTLPTDPAVRAAVVPA
jgi:signal transduction histidine kinase